jgi:predicted transcriptional regulator of viral defense system
MTLIKEFLQKRPSKQTVFTVAEIAQITESSDSDKLKLALSNGARKGDLIRISRGLYAVNENYSLLELGAKLRRPSYLSFYSVLQEQGVVFQGYSSLFYATNRSEELRLKGQKFIYRKIKDEILLNPLGIDSGGPVARASLERALCEQLYLDGEEYFDNLRAVNWQLMKKINKKVYKNNSRIAAFISNNS